MPGLTNCTQEYMSLGQEQIQAWIGALEPCCSHSGAFKSWNMNLFRQCSFQLLLLNSAMHAWVLWAYTIFLYAHEAEKRTTSLSHAVTIYTRQPLLPSLYPSFDCMLDIPYHTLFLIIVFSHSSAHSGKSVTRKIALGSFQSQSAGNQRIQKPTN